MVLEQWGKRCSWTENSRKTHYRLVSHNSIVWTMSNTGEGAKSNLHKRRMNHPITTLCQSDKGNIRNANKASGLHIPASARWQPWCEEGGRLTTSAHDHLLIRKQPVHFCVSMQLRHTHPVHPSTPRSLQINMSLDNSTETWRFQFNTRKRFSQQRRLNTRASREAVECPSLEIFRIQQDKALSNLI